MKELIKITENNGKKAVSARELHAFLESKKQFADWIKHRISKYGLIENIDYQTLSLNGENGRPAIEYALTIDAAKELSMVEGNHKRKQARQYFIECEKQASKPLNSLDYLQYQLNLMKAQSARIEAMKQKCMN